MFIPGRGAQLGVLLFKALQSLWGTVSSRHRTAEVAALFHICTIAGVCESGKPKIFNVDGYERRELPNIIWCSALLQLQLRKILPNCLIPGSSANFFLVLFFLFHGRALLGSNISATTTWQAVCQTPGETILAKGKSRN